MTTRIAERRRGEPVTVGVEVRFRTGALPLGFSFSTESSSEGDSVLVCSANAVGTVEAAGGKGADYRIILPSGISSLLPEGDELDAASTPQSQGD